MIAMAWGVSIIRSSWATSPGSIGSALSIEAWIFSPLAMVGATVLVVAILYGREFRSEVLTILRE